MLIDSNVVLYGVLPGVNQNFHFQGTILDTLDMIYSLRR